MTNNLRAQYSQHNSFFPCLKKRIHCPVTNITYQLEEQIGSGSAAVVFRAQRVFLNKETQAQTTFVDKATEYAVKVFNLRRMRLHSNYEREQEKLKREMNILKSLHHPCIVNLLHVIETKNKLYFIMELIKGGELFDKIIDKGSFNETEARYIIIQILYALHYLHEKNIIHRDLKPENILIADESFPDFYNVKIADFGLAKCFRDGFDEAATFVGTPQYWAPEVIDSASGICSYGTQADLWSLGCVIYVMLGGAYPFDTRLGPIDKLIKQASFHFNHPRFQSISNNAKHLIKGLLTVDPKKRFSIKQVFQHPWIESFHFFKNINPSVIPAQPNVSHSLHSENTSSTPLLPSFSKYSSSVPLFNVKAPIEDIFKKKHSSCSIDVTKSKPLNYTTSNQSLHSHSNLSIPSPSISDPHDLSNLKIHDAQNDLFSKPLLNERSEPRDIILSPKASFSSLSSNRILLPAQSTPALYDTTRHDTYRELYPFAEPKTIADKKYRKVQNVDNSNYTTNSQHSEKIVHHMQNPPVLDTQHHYSRSFESINLDSNMFFTHPSLLKTNTVNSHCSLPITFYHTTRMIFSLFQRRHNVSTNSTEMMFNLKNLLCLQMTITQKIKCLYIILRYSPKILRPLQECILKKYEIQRDSIHIIKQFESICLSVLALFPDLFWAASTNQLDFGLQLLNDVLLWISSLKQKILRHQQCVEDFLRQISALLSIIEAVQIVSRENLISVIHSTNISLTDYCYPKQLFTEKSPMDFHADVISISCGDSSGLTQRVIPKNISHEKQCNVTKVSSLQVAPEHPKINSKHLFLSVQPTLETFHDQDHSLSLNQCREFLLPLNTTVQCTLQDDIYIKSLHTYCDKIRSGVFKELVVLVENTIKCIMKEKYNCLYHESWHSNMPSQSNLHQYNSSDFQSFWNTHMLNSQTNETPLIVFRNSDTLCIVNELFNFILMASRFYSVAQFYNASTSNSVCQSFFKTLPSVPPEISSTDICYTDPFTFLSKTSDVSSNYNLFLNRTKNVNKNLTKSFFLNPIHHSNVHTGKTVSYSRQSDLPLTTTHVNDTRKNDLFPCSSDVEHLSRPMNNSMTSSVPFLDTKEGLPSNKEHNNSSSLKETLQTSSDYLNRTKTSLIFLNQNSLSSMFQNKSIEQVKPFDRLEQKEMPSFFQTSAYHDALWTTHVLAFAIQELKQVKQILQQCLSFWMSFIVIIERLSLIRIHTTRLLQNSMLSPYLTKRLQNTLVHYKHFWNRIKDQLCYYSQNAQGKIDTMEEFVINLNKIAEDVDTLLPLH